MPLSFWSLCLGPRKPLHVLIQLVEVKPAEAWGNWEMPREKVIVNWCELCQDVSACTFCTALCSMFEVLEHFWNSTSSNAFRIFRSYRVCFGRFCEGLTYGRLRRDSCDSGSPECGLVSASGILMNFPHMVCFSGRFSWYYVQNCSIICSKNVSICSNVFEGCWGQGGLAWIAWCLRNVHEFLKDSVELLTHSQNLHRRVGELGPSTLTRGSSEFQAHQRSNCLPMSQRFAKCFFDFWRIFTFLAFHVKYPTSNRYLTEVILCFILL